MFDILVYKMMDEVMDAENEAIMATITAMMKRQQAQKKSKI
jgi:hypothetical protein